MTDDLLTCALAAVRSYWDGSDKSRIDLRQAMTDLRCAAFAEQKRRQQEDTAKIVRTAPVIGLVSFAAPSPPPVVVRPPPFDPGNQPHG